MDHLQTKCQITDSIVGSPQEYVRINHILPIHVDFELKWKDSMSIPPKTYELKDQRIDWLMWNIHFWFRASRKIISQTTLPFSHAILWQFYYEKLTHRPLPIASINQNNTPQNTQTSEAKTLIKFTNLGADLGLGLRNATNSILTKKRHNPNPTQSW